MEQVLPAKVQSLASSYIRVLADMALVIRDCTGSLPWVLYAVAKCNTQVSVKPTQVACSIQQLAAYVTEKQGTQRDGSGHILITFAFGNAASILKHRHWSLALTEFRSSVKAETIPGRPWYPWADSVLVFAPHEQSQVVYELQCS